jgi:hypothetical protein
MKNGEATRAAFGALLGCIGEIPERNSSSVIPVT